MTLYRLTEYKTFLYRLLLAYFFYFIARIIFVVFNPNLFAINGVVDFLSLSFYGLAFDTTAIIYVNLLFIVLSVLPLWVNTQKWFQKYLMFIYFFTNFIAYAFNFVDVIYYRFSKTRTTIGTFDLLENEQNKVSLFTHFLLTYWYVLFIFIALCLLWIWLYQQVKTNTEIIKSKFAYFGFSLVFFLLTIALSIGGIRGGFAHSTRPINLVDAYKHVRITNQGDVVLNTPFSIIRTVGTSNFKLQNWVTEDYIRQQIKPIKVYQSARTNKPNVVLFILESMASEYWGSMNRHKNVQNFKSYTPFLDSLSNHSLIFSHAFANGRQSIHAMSSVLAGIPSFENAFTSSPYAKQEIESLVSITNKMGYETSFFHGAANGSMGFMGFASILGFKNYFGRTEYNNDADYDGIWGIWDEPFFRFMGEKVGQQKQPFMATLFSVSSHDPFNVPEKYKSKFKGGPLQIHRCVQYTDHSLRQFFTYAKTQSWYNNTIFILTADHTNQSLYPEYNNATNAFSVPILFFSPNKSYALQGERSDLAAQIDIYPTVVDLLGYQNPFRSWGRSLTANLPSETPRVINSTGSIYQLLQKKYVYLFDGEKFTGIYQLEDKGFKHNLIHRSNEKEVQKGMSDCKAFIQDYMYRIVNRKLNK
ncbi:MAG: sulfatase-like hydrolase/transferase [Sphingobacteriaceae bacterium]|nr:sulfatase-like hydrolase/transferase [Sphingobacteriaceae bacterium]